MAICQASGWVAKFQVTYSDDNRHNEELPVVAWVEDEGYCDGLVYVESMERLVTARQYTDRYGNVKFLGYENVTPCIVPAHPGERLHYSTGESVRVLSWVVKGEFGAFTDVRALIVDGDGCGQVTEIDGAPNDGDGFNHGWIADNWRDEEVQGGEK